MTNYRRLISYIYAYEGQVKGKNIGFAKLESRNGQCKLSVNVKKVYVGSSDLGVYLLAPGKEIFLGSIFIRGGSGEFRAAVAVDNAADSGCSMDQCYGLTIHEKGDSWRAYTTIWEDAVAHAAELELAGVTSESRGNTDEQIHKKIRELDRELKAQENGSGQVPVAEPDIEPEIIDIPVDPEIEEPGKGKPAIEEPDVSQAEIRGDVSPQAGSEDPSIGLEGPAQAQERGAEDPAQVRGAGVDDPQQAQAQGTGAQDPQQAQAQGIGAQDPQQAQAQGIQPQGQVQARKIEGEEPEQAQGIGAGDPAKAQGNGSGGSTDWTQEALRLERYAQENIQAAARIEGQAGLDGRPEAQEVEVGSGPQEIEMENQISEGIWKGEPAERTQDGFVSHMEEGGYEASAPEAEGRQSPEEYAVERQWNQGVNQEIQSAQEAVLKEEPGRVQPLGSSPAAHVTAGPGESDDSRPASNIGIPENVEGDGKTNQTPGAMEPHGSGVARGAQTAPVTRMPSSFGTARPANRVPVSRMTPPFGGFRPAQVARMAPIPGVGRPASGSPAAGMSAPAGGSRAVGGSPVPGVTAPAGGSRAVGGSPAVGMTVPTAGSPTAPETSSAAMPPVSGGAPSDGNPHAAPISPGDDIASSAPESPASAAADQTPVVDTGEPALPLGDPEELARLEEEEQEHYQPQQLWEEFRKRYPKIQAFDSANGCEILTIKPQDIGLLPRENWNYGNNSFLLHGYYNYRYLVLARIGGEGGSRIRYILGVPGHYYSNEKYMASMFGFPHFVLSKKQPSQDGRFGYWYTDIRLQNQD